MYRQKYCKKCGNKIQNTDAYCFFCGIKIISNTNEKKTSAIPSRSIQEPNLSTDKNLEENKVAEIAKKPETNKATEVVKNQEINKVTEIGTNLAENNTNLKNANDHQYQIREESRDLERYLKLKNGIIATNTIDKEVADNLVFTTEKERNQEILDRDYLGANKDLYQTDRTILSNINLDYDEREQFLELDKSRAQEEVARILENKEILDLEDEPLSKQEYAHKITEKNIAVNPAENNKASIANNQIQNNKKNKEKKAIDNNLIDLDKNSKTIREDSQQNYLHILEHELDILEDEVAGFNSQYNKPIQETTEYEKKIVENIEDNISLDELAKADYELDQYIKLMGSSSLEQAKEDQSQQLISNKKEVVTKTTYPEKDLEINIDLKIEKDSEINPDIKLDQGLEITKNTELEKDSEISTDLKIEKDSEINIDTKLDKGLEISKNTELDKNSEINTELDKDTQKQQNQKSHKKLIIFLVFLGILLVAGAVLAYIFRVDIVEWLNTVVEGKTHMTLYNSKSML